MAKQLIISIGREYGSGGHAIARLLAQRFQLPLYNGNMLDEIAARRGVDVERLRRLDETPRTKLIYRTVNGFSNSPEATLAQMQFQYLTERAEAGESFIVLGRCGEEILRRHPAMVSIFVLADQDFKQQRVMEWEQVDEDKALAIMVRGDRRRKNYHNEFSKGKWGDSRNYDLTINTARLGVEGTAVILEAYIRARMEHIE